MMRSEAPAIPEYYLTSDETMTNTSSTPFQVLALLLLLSEAPSRLHQFLLQPVQGSLSRYVIDMDKMKSLVLLALLLLQLPVPTTLTGHWEEYEQHNNKSCCSWKCLLFTLQWPAGFCQEG
ncbi:hypothetical protein INR49_027529 [Caranx melampygus]|nr:hypothetical protein INR49_027529 [Caranx melampygus]